MYQASHVAELLLIVGLAVCWLKVRSAPAYHLVFNYIGCAALYGRHGQVLLQSGRSAFIIHLPVEHLHPRALSR